MTFKPQLGLLQEAAWRLLDAKTKRHKMTWKWLKGHAGHPENERCDALAKAEMDKIKSSYSREQLAAFLTAFRAVGGPPQQSLL